jgi:hypothetical protein
MALTLKLPRRPAALENYTLRGTTPVQPAKGVKFNRIAYSAAHVVADPLAAVDPWLQLRHRLGRHHRLPPAACGRWAWAWPRPWTRRSAAWAWTGRPRWN